MAKKSVKSAYIGSEDYWEFAEKSYNDDTQFYGSAWVVPASKVTDTMKEDSNISRCQMYFEVGRTDGHLFTPSTIIYDDKAKFLIVKGEQGRIGDEGKTSTKTKAFAVGQLAQRYKNLTESASSKAPARFTVNYIVIDDTDGKEKIQAFVKELNGDEVEEEEEEIVTAEAETTLGHMEAEEMNVKEMNAEEMNAEEMNAENLPRVNPTVVEGAEDVHGAEEDYTSAGMANPEVFGEFVNDNIIGQGFDGQVIGQAAETEEAMVQSEFGDVGQGNDFGQMRAEGYDYDPMEYSPFDNPEDFDPRMMEADDIVEWFQELPFVDGFRLSGWTASAMVVGIAAITGVWFSKR